MTPVSRSEALPVTVMLPCSLLELSAGVLTVRLGAPVSISQLFTAAVGDRFPAGSSALTLKLWLPWESAG